MFFSKKIMTFFVLNLLKILSKYYVIMKKSKRLELICEKVRDISLRLGKTPSLIDVGCDHGILGKMLLDEQVLSSLIESDISEKCLEKAKKLLFEKNNVVSFRVGDGLKVLSPGEFVNVAVIAGMGGREIAKIIRDKVKVSQIGYLVLQTATDDLEIIREIRLNGFEVVFDNLLLENGHLYRTIVIDTTNKHKFDNAYYYYGKDNKKNSAEIDFEIKRLQSVKENIICGFDEQSISKSASQKIAEIDARLDCIKNNYL